MSDTTPTDADDLRSEIEATRADLAATAEALSAKLDVKAQAKAKATQLKTSIEEVAAKASGHSPAPGSSSTRLDLADPAPPRSRATAVRTSVALVALVTALVVIGQRRRRRSQ